MHAQQHGARVEQVLDRLDVERVRHQPRGVGDGRVERVEVVVGGLDLRSLGDVEAQADEHVLHLAPRLGDQVQAPGRRERVGRQRHVDAVLHQAQLELARCQRLLARRDGGFERLAGGVGGLADGATLLGRELRDTPQQIGQLGLAAQVADPDVLKGVGVGRCVDRGARLLLELLDPVDHAGAILVIS